MSCAAVTSVLCESPANLTFAAPLRTQCFACGEPVCKACSRLMRWYRYGRRRICDRCREDDAR